MAYGQAVQVGHVMNVSTVDRQSGSLKTIETLEIFNLSLISLPFHFGVLRSASVFVFYVAWQAGFKNDTRITRALGWQSARVSQSAKSRIFESRKSMGLHFCRGSELVVPLFDTSRKCLGPEFKIFKGTFGKTGVSMLWHEDAWNCEGAIKCINKQEGGEVRNIRVSATIKRSGFLFMCFHGTGTKFSQEDIVYVTEAWCIQQLQTSNTSTKSPSNLWR